MHGDALQADGLKSLPHDELGYVLPPRTSDSFTARDFRFDYTTDEHGFRNPSPWPDWADVVVLGDSQAFGFGVDDGEDWVRVMDAALPDVEVINLGLFGAAPQQFLRLFEAHGVALRPKVVVVALFPPNALYAARLFDEWIEEGKPDRFDARRLDAADSGAGATIKDFVRQSYLAQYLVHSVKSLGATIPARTESFADGGRLVLLPDQYKRVEESTRPGNPDFELVMDTIQRIRGAVRARDAELLVLLFPTKEEVHLPLIGERAPDLLAPFVAELDRLGIAYLDLSHALRKSFELGRKPFLEVDLHANVEGNRIIGEMVADHLSRAVLNRRSPGDRSR